MTSSPFLPFPRLGFGTGPGLFPHRADKPFFALPFIDHVDDRSRDGDFFRQELADGDDFFDFGGDEISRISDGTVRRPRIHAEIEVPCRIGFGRLDQGYVGMER